MRTLRILIVATGCIAVLVVAGCDRGSKKPELKTLPGQIVLIGVKTGDDLESRRILTMTPDGSDLRTLLRVDEGSISIGRLSPNRKRLAFTCVKGYSELEVWLLEEDGQTRIVTEQGGHVTAWSPDGKQLAFYRAERKDNAETYENFEINIATKQQRKLELSKEYVAEDWHPRENIRIICYFNPGKSIHQEKPRPNTYFLRQLELLTADNKRIPITKDPSLDNIYSRYSPAGDRIVYYRRRVLDESAKEFAVVSAADGTSAKEVFAFTDTSEAEKLNWFHPHAFPAWSPDGKTIAWLVSVTDAAKPTLDNFDLVFFPAEGGAMRRISLTPLGIKWVGGIDWR
jgi:Tol biopolymer transport system component